MSHTDPEEVENGKNGSDREMLEESDQDNRWTPVALKLAVHVSEECSGLESEDQEDQYDRFAREDRWTPVALQLAMSGGGRV